jgi:hypothetical protein
MATRADVQKVVREYIDTKFHPIGRVKGGGVDCVGLVLCVSEDLNLKDSAGVPFRRMDYPKYSVQAIDSKVQDECKRRMIEKMKMNLLPGDVVTMKVPYNPCHTGIITEIGGVLHIVHALNSGSRPRVIEHILDKKWRHCITGAFSLPGVE